MKKQLVKSLVAALSVAALSLGIIPGGGMAERLGIVTESRAAEEYSISAQVGISFTQSPETNYNVLMGLKNTWGSFQDWGNGLAIPDNVERAFQKAIDEGKVKGGRKAETYSGGFYIAGCTLNYNEVDYIEYTFYLLVYDPNRGIDYDTMNVSREVQAGNTVYTVDAKGGVDYYLFSTNNATPSTQPTISNTTASGDSHQHAYDWKILTDPTIDQDGVYAYMCSCGDVKEKQPITAAQVFVKELYGKVKEAPQNGTVIYDAKSWSTISDYILKKMAERSDAAVTIKFNYQKAAYEITFPAGTDYTPVLNDTETMYGFFGIAKLLGLDVKAL